MPAFQMNTYRSVAISVPVLGDGRIHHVMDKPLMIDGSIHHFYTEHTNSKTVKTGQNQALSPFKRRGTYPAIGKVMGDEDKNRKYVIKLTHLKNGDITASYGDWILARKSGNNVRIINEHAPQEMKRQALIELGKL